MVGFTHNQLKNKSFDAVQKAFDKTMSWIVSFVPIDSKVVKGSKDKAEGSETREKGSSKRVGEDLQQESTKKQKIDDDKEKEELKQCFEIVLDDGDDVTIDATPLSVKIPIVDYKIYQEGKKSFFQLIRAYVKARFKKTKTVDYMDTFLLLTLKTMFEYHVEDKVWKRQQEGDEDEDMHYTTSQLYDDVDIWLNEPVDTDKGFVQEEGTDAAMTNVQQVNENPEILQVIEDAHVTLSTDPQKTEVPVTNSSHSSDLAAKVLNFLDIPHTDAEVVSPMDVHVHHEVPSQQTPKLLTVPVSIISYSLPVFSTVIPKSLPPFTSPPQQLTPTPPTTTKATNPQSALPNFAFIF
ncbi:hypothetical protein Tco_0179713 [Tanacetum coccineum]